MSHKKIIGLLGGIASGKSTAAAEFAKLGCAVIDADSIAKRLLCDAKIQEQIRQEFGESVFGEGGGIDKKRFAEKIFSSRESVDAVNSIIHPPVLAEVERLIAYYDRQEGVRAIVLDIPLLVEAGCHKMCDKLIFIDCSEALRLKRAEKRVFFDKKELKKREKFQISLDKKKKLANFVIENEDLSKFVSQIGELFPVLVS